jgi:hypothetical protein
VKHDVYRDGRVHVMRERCETCIFRAGNLMSLRRGRVRGMIDAAHEVGSAIVCHETYEGPHAICRGFFDLHPTPALLLADALEVVTEVEP